MAEVRFEHLTKEFPGGTLALDDVSLEVSDGEFMILVGPSGCGKTTALRCVAGLEKPTRGRILIGGTVVNGVSPHDRDIAMVFQNYALYPHMTVYRNLAFGLKERRTPKAEIDRRGRPPNRPPGPGAALEGGPSPPPRTASRRSSSWSTWWNRSATRSWCTARPAERRSRPAPRRRTRRKSGPRPRTRGRRSR